MFTKDLLDSEASSTPSPGSQKCIQCNLKRKRISELSNELEVLKKTKTSLESKLQDALKTISHLKGNLFNMYIHLRIKLSWHNYVTI